MSVTDLIQININSGLQNIASGTTDNFYYNINVPSEQIARINSVSLISCSLPKSFYQINELNNEFTLVENAVYIPITVIAGNYSA